MNAHNLHIIGLKNTTLNNDNDEYDIPLNISDLISICHEFNKLGWQVQAQMEQILEFGVEQSIKSGFVNRQSLSHIKSFLKSIMRNAYFGDAVYQAEECINLICEYEEKYKINYAENN